MKLDILTPAKTLFSGQVDSVTLPGTLGMFTVLENHAPMISSLRRNGKITYGKGDQKTSITIDGGFAEVLGNVVTVCVETHLTEDTNEEEKPGNPDM